MTTCHKCGKRELCAACGRCPGEGHLPDCPSAAAQAARAAIAALNKPKERTVGLLRIIMREEGDEAQ